MAVLPAPCFAQAVEFTALRWSTQGTTTTHLLTQPLVTAAASPTGTTNTCSAYDDCYISYRIMQ
jgi:hypothetical protein